MAFMDLWFFFVVLTIVVSGLGLMKNSPIKVLITLEFLFLIIGVFYILSSFSFWGWWFLFIFVFGACEGVWVLTANMVLSKFFSDSASGKFFKW